MTNKPEKPALQEIRELIDRLNGIYTVPVNDGAGPLNGKDTFTRTFEVPPIHKEAAAALRAICDEVERLRNQVGADLIQKAALEKQLAEMREELKIQDDANDILTGRYESLQAENQRLRDNLLRLVKYSEWQMEEGGPYHPTLPSAVGAAREAINKEGE